MLNLTVLQKHQDKQESTKRLFYIHIHFSPLIKYVITYIANTV